MSNTSLNSHLDADSKAYTERKMGEIREEVLSPIPYDDETKERVSQLCDGITDEE